jgi:formyl-CoA transferase
VLELLLGEADVFLSNYRYNALERLNLGRDALRARFPKLICCYISGKSQSSAPRCNEV